MSSHKNTKKDFPISDLFPTLIEKYWDYEKNNVSPTEVYLTSTDNYWWKGYCSSFKMPVQYLSAKPAGTSFPEQTILYYLKQNNLNIKNRHKFTFDNKKYEVDIFVEDCKTAIEYDGFVWHKNKYDKDIEKNKILESIGICLIKIRESGLLSTNITNGIEITNNLDENPYIALAKCINILFNYIETKLNKSLPTISAEDIKKDKIYIYQQYLSTFEENNIATTWLSKYWAKENLIEPYLVPTNSSEKHLFMCTNKQILEISPNSIMSTYHNMPTTLSEKYKESLIVNDCCPWGARQFCPANYYTHIYNYIDCRFNYVLQQVPFQVIKDSFIQQIFSDFQIDTFIDTIYKLTKYATNEPSDLLDFFIKNSPLDNDSKRTTIYKIFNSVNILNADNFWRLFTNLDFVDFYINNYRFGEIYNQGLFLNLSHSQNIYSILKKLLKKNKFDIVSLLISKIEHKLKLEDFSMFIYNLLTQIYSTTNYSMGISVKNIPYKNILKNFFCKNILPEINEKIDNMFNSNRNLFIQKLYCDYIKNLKNKGIFEDYYWKTLNYRVTFDTFIKIKYEVEKDDRLLELPSIISYKFNEINFNSNNFILNAVTINANLSLNICIENHNPCAMESFNCIKIFLLQNSNITNFTTVCKRTKAKELLEKYNAKSWYNTHSDKYIYHVDFWDFLHKEEFSIAQNDNERFFINNYYNSRYSSGILPYSKCNCILNTLGNKVTPSTPLQFLIFFYISYNFYNTYLLGVYIENNKYFTNVISEEEMKKILGNEYYNFYQDKPLSNNIILSLINFIKQGKPRIIEK